MQIYKFGGTSVGSARRMQNTLDILRKDRARKCVVLSAMAGTTNHLKAIADKLYQKEVASAKLMVDEMSESYIETVNELFTRPSFRDIGKDVINNYFYRLGKLIHQPFNEAQEKVLLAQGELMSTSLFHLLCCEQDVKSVWLDAREIMRIDAAAQPDLDYISTQIHQQLSRYEEAELFIIQGYICKNSQEGIDNLGRGGSDYSATILGAVLEAAAVQIWTDIDGVHTNDPRVVNHTSPIRYLSYQEASKMAYFGAKVLHPLCILPAERVGVPVVLKNTMEPDAPGTLISEYTEENTVTGISAKDNITYLSISTDEVGAPHLFLQKVFALVAEYQIEIDMISTSACSIALGICPSLNEYDFIAALQELGSVRIENQQCIINVVGNFDAYEGDQAAVEILAAIRSVPRRMISFSCGTGNLLILVDGMHKDLVLRSLNTLVSPVEKVASEPATDQLPLRRLAAAR